MSSLKNSSSFSQGSFGVLLTQLHNSVVESDILQICSKIGSKVDSINLWTRGNFKNCGYGLLTTRSAKLNKFLME
jgi:hypothetical protein